MQSEDNHPEIPPTEVAGTPTSSPTPLRREAMMVATERQNSALFAALFSLAGVGFGFGLSQLASAGHNCSHMVTVQHEQSQARAPAPTLLASPAPIAKLTWLGVEGHSYGAQGALVDEVFPGSPAEAAGIEDGSVILSMDRTMITNFGSLISEVRNHSKGDRVRVRFADLGGDTQETWVTLGEISRNDFRQLSFER
jgi:hypothetical protein